MKKKHMNPIETLNAIGESLIEEAAKMFVKFSERKLKEFKYNSAEILGQDVVFKYLYKDEKEVIDVFSYYKSGGSLFYSQSK